MEDRGALDHPFSLMATPTALSLLCTKRPLSDRRQRAERGKEGRQTNRKRRREIIARGAWEEPKNCSRLAVCTCLYGRLISPRGSTFCLYPLLFSPSNNSRD